MDIIAPFRLNYATLGRHSNHKGVGCGWTIPDNNGMSEYDGDGYIYGGGDGDGRCSGYLTGIAFVFATDFTGSIIITRVRTWI